MKRILKWLAIALVVLIVGVAVWGYAPDTDPAAMRAKYANAASQFVEVAPGLKVHFRDEGKRDGPALLLIHGSNSSLHTWEPWVKRLGADYRIISLDLPGHGLTGPNPKNDYSAAVMVGATDGVMTRLGLNRFAVAGNSMGGWVAWSYALAHPEKLSALILVDASGAPDAKPRVLPIGFRIAQNPLMRPLMTAFTPRSIIASSLEQSVSVKSVVTDAAIDRYWELLRYPGNRAATAERNREYAARKPASPEAIKSIRAPTLVMWGAEDTLIPASAASWFEAAIPGAKKIVYPKVGHIPMEELPDQSAADVQAFLEATR